MFIRLTTPFISSSFVDHPAWCLFLRVGPSWSLPRNCNNRLVFILVCDMCYNIKPANTPSTALPFPCETHPAQRLLATFGCRSFLVFWAAVPSKRFAHFPVYLFIQPRSFMNTVHVREATGFTAAPVALFVLMFIFGVLRPTPMDAKT